jgi:hypothetical protein
VTPPKFGRSFVRLYFILVEGKKEEENILKKGRKEGRKGGGKEGRREGRRKKMYRRKCIEGRKEVCKYVSM